MPAGRIFVRHFGRTAEASPQDISVLEERLLAGILAAARRTAYAQEQATYIANEQLSLAQQQAARTDEARARSRAPAFGASRLGEGFALTAPHRVSGFLRNGGESAALVKDARLHYPGRGAVPGAIKPVYGSGPPGDGATQARIEYGVELLLNFDHALLRDAAQANGPLIVELLFDDDDGFAWRCEAVLRRQGADAQNRPMWRLHEVNPQMLGRASS